MNNDLNSNMNDMIELVKELAILNGTSSALNNVDISSFNSVKEFAEFIHRNIYLKF